ncbi:MAG: DUF1326 domain-containing protein [Acidobacteriota bacterium]
MNRNLTKLALTAACFCLQTGIVKSAPPPAAEWHMNASIIEACSCPMFCQCYFNPKPAEHTGHGGHDKGHFCRFNNAVKVNKGHYGGVQLDGAKFWVAGDLGGDFSHGQMDWAVVTFDKGMSADQRKAVQAILAHVYPVKWNSLTTAEGSIDWKAEKTEARAVIDGGKTAEVALKAMANSNVAAEPVVIKNLKYWGVPRNDGFVLMPNVVEAYRAGCKPFEFRGTNGFMITFDIDSKTAPPAAQ